MDRIIFDQDRAVGLEIIDTSTDPPTKTQIRARKKVLICAGAFGSPSILERSGIGGKALLDSLGVTVKVDLPGVGENYQDHEVRVKF